MYIDRYYTGSNSQDSGVALLGRCLAVERCKIILSKHKHLDRIILAEGICYYHIRDVVGRR